MKSWTVLSFSEQQANASLMAFDGDARPWFYSHTDGRMFSDADEILLPPYIQDVKSMHFLVFEQIWVISTASDVYAYQNDEWLKVGEIEDGIQVIALLLNQGNRGKSRSIGYSHCVWE